MLNKCFLSSSNFYGFITRKNKRTSFLFSIGRSLREAKGVMGSPGGSDSKESTSNTGDPGSIPVLGRHPGEGNGNPLWYSCLEKSYGQRSLAGHSPWVYKKLDTTELLLHFTESRKTVLMNLFAGQCW